MAVTSLERTDRDHDEEQKKESSWIEIEMVDEMGRPWANEAYEIVAPDGETIRRGTLDRSGQAHVYVADPGECRIRFPELDAAAWTRN